MMATSTTEVLKQLHELEANLPADESGRRQVAEAAKNLARAAEPVYDQTQRLVYSNLILPLVRVAVDLELFQTLSSDPAKSFATDELAVTTKADPLILTRILRFLGAYKLIAEPSSGYWAANAWTQDLADCGNMNGVLHQYDSCGPAYTALPGFLKRNRYGNIEDGTQCPFQDGHNTSKGLFEWYGDRPDNLAYFMQWLPKHRGDIQWTDTGLIDELSKKGGQEETILFVDVGGNIGDVCVDVRKKVPNARGRIINQDLPHVVKNTIQFPGVEKSAHDFWTPQAIKGARVYYMRNILHDWPNRRCEDILQNLLPAMNDDSEIWIHEIVLPDQGATEAQVNWDWTMASVVAGMERSNDQWVKLVEDAGFLIRQVHPVSPERGEAVIVVVMK